MPITKNNIKTFTYEGRDDMIDFKNPEVPSVHKDFKATLKLKDGTEVEATRVWRKRIWTWWYKERREEITKNVLIAFSKSVTPSLRHG